MRNFTILLLGAVLLMTMGSWGFYAHKMINRAAVFTLPADMASFYKQHIDYISDHAVDPDKKRYADPEEAHKHFIDLDRYGESPLDSLPERWTNAIRRYPEDTLKANGTVPWQIYSSYWNLVDAFKSKNSLRILKTSTALGHYIADAHSPLHTTQNYNGGLSDQEGIHAFWESRLPELYAKGYSFFVGGAQYIDKPLQRAWQIVGHTYSLVDSVLLIEAQLNRKFAQNRKYVFERRNKLIIRTYSKTYSKAYHKALNGMVEKQMRASVILIGSFWYTAWVDAGQPNLQQLSGTAFIPDSSAHPLHTQSRPTGVSGGAPHQRLHHYAPKPYKKPFRLYSHGTMLWDDHRHAFHPDNYPHPLSARHEPGYSFS